MFINKFFIGDIKMMNSKTKKITSLILILGVSSLQAGTIRSQGTAGASQLLIPVGAENIAQGGSNTATSTGVDALYVNPAGTSGISGAQVTVSSMTYIADIDVTYMGVVAALGDKGTVGLSMKTLDFGEIPVTTAEETEGTGEMYSPNFMTATANYSRPFADNVRFGASLKFISEQIINTSANGVAADLGVQYKFNELPLSIGIALKNLGGRMEYDGSDLEQTHVPEGSESGSISEQFRVKSQSFELPAQLDIGLAYSTPVPGLDLMASFTNNSFSTNIMSFSGKYSSSRFWVAGGMSTQSGVGEDDDFSSAQWDDMTKGIYGATFGAGVTIPVGELMLDVGYSLRTVSEYFDDNSVIEMKVNF
tara:strand:- start:747 stop:1838 length:1092 start_codon:yes stop_codon:yes gene_type:complete